MNARRSIDSILRARTTRLAPQDTGAQSTGAQSTGARATGARARRAKALASHLLVLGALATPAMGCQVYDPGLIENDAGQDAGTVDAGPCNLRQPAARPEGDGDDGEEYLFGLRDVVLDQGGERWREIGLDLDGRCTVAPAFDTECLPPRRARPPSDGEDGIDNTFGSSLFPLVDLTIPGLEDTARAAQDLGKLPVMRLRGWNGTDNDARVDIAITNAIFTVPANDDGSPREIDAVGFEAVELDGTPAPPPVWDGTDHGYFRDTTFFGGDPDRPLLRDDNAYVSGRMLVARLPERVEILFPAEDVGLLVLLTDATAIGRISEDGQTVDDLIVTGRWALLDLLATAENVGVCPGTDGYNILANQLDTIADLRSMPGSGGEGVVCDAISLGVGFRGYRMRWGGLTPGPGVRNVCTDMDGGVPDGGQSDAGADSGTSSDAGPEDGGAIDAGIDGGEDAG